MTVYQFCENENLTILNKGDDCEITGGFSGDLLSWAMANAQEGNVWFTVMGNINSIAVASLNDVPCIVFCQGSPLNDDALQRAKLENITIATTKLSIFEISGMLYNQLK